MYPAVSVIVPVYNSAPYLKRCIESIQNQTLTNIEIIIINDGSTDESRKIMERYAINDQRIKLVNKPNGGPSSARKAGIRMVQAKYVGFVDSDDWIEEDMYENLYEICKEKPSDIIDSGIILESESEIRKIVREKMYFNNLTKEDRQNLFPFRESISHLLPGSLWSKLYRQEYIQFYTDIIPDYLCSGEDIIFNTYLLMQCTSYANIDKAFYHYCTYNSSLTKSSSWSWFIQYLKEYQCISQLLTKYSYDDITCCDELTNFMYGAFRSLLNRMNHSTAYEVPNISKLRNMSVILYGAGKVGYSYYRQLSLYQDINILNWVDKHPEKYDFPFAKIDHPFTDNVSYSKADLIIIAVKHSDLAEIIRRDLINHGIKPKKIVWLKPRE